MHHFATNFPLLMILTMNTIACKYCYCCSFQCRCFYLLRSLCGGDDDDGGEGVCRTVNVGTSHTVSAEIPRTLLLIAAHFSLENKPRTCVDLAMEACEDTPTANIY